MVCSLPQKPRCPLLASVRRPAMAEERRWEDLHPDLLAEAFARVDLLDRFFVLPFVCRRWRTAALHPSTWKRIDLRHAYTLAYARLFWNKYGRFSHTRIFSTVVRRSVGGATHLLLPPDRLYWGKLSQEDLRILGDRCPKMKVVGYVCVHNEREILGIISKWKDLEALALQGCMLYSKEILAEIREHCVNFTSLHICDKDLEEKDVAAIVTCLPELKNLQIRNCEISRDVLIKILEGCEQLVCLSIKYCYGFDVDDEIMKCGARIKRFICDGCQDQGSRRNMADLIDYELNDVLRL